MPLKMMLARSPGDCVLEPRSIRRTLNTSPASVSTVKNSVEVVSPNAPNKDSGASTAPRNNKTRINAGKETTDLFAKAKAVGFTGRWGVFRDDVRPDSTAA